jgi:hypothetical protein
MTKRKLLQYNNLVFVGYIFSSCLFGCKKYTDGWSSCFKVTGTINNQSMADKIGMCTFFKEADNRATISWYFDAGQATAFHVGVYHIPLGLEGKTRLWPKISSAGLTYDGDQPIENYEIYDKDSANNWIRIISYNRNFRKLKYELNGTYVITAPRGPSFGNADPFNKADTLRVRNLVVDVVDK